MPIFFTDRLANLDMGYFDTWHPHMVTVPALAGICHAAHAYPVDDGRSLYFESDARGNQDVWRYDMISGQIDTLPEINTTEDEAQFAITAGGRVMVFVRGAPGHQRLVRADLTRNQVYEEQIPRLSEATLANPTINADGTRVVFAATLNGRSHLRVYDFIKHCELTPPFVDDAADEDFPWFFPDGTKLVFSSDRRGTLDLYMADMTTGQVDDLPLVNSPAREIAPSYIGGTTFLFVSDRTGVDRVYTYDWIRQRLDTLPY